MLTGSIPVISTNVIKVLKEGNEMMICTSGMIGVGKSTLAKRIAQHFGTEVFYEKVDGNEILPLFYTLSEEELLKQRIPFLLQLDFLDSRFKTIKQSLIDDNTVNDRSIYEDKYFCRKNMELGRITELEYKIYCNLVDNMMEELKELPKKAPDLMIYLKADFDTILSRIANRSREYEIDESLKEYYYFLWKDYDEWANEYDSSQILIIDTNELDLANNEEDVAYVLNLIEEKLKEVRSK